MKTFRDFLNEAKITNDAEFIKYLDDLIINLKKHKSGKEIASNLEKVSTELEKNIDDRKAQSRLIGLLSELPNDRMIIRISDDLEDYLESL